MLIDCHNHMRYMSMRYRLSLIFLLVIFCFNCFAQEEQVNFRKISTADGLSQSSVITINQDHLGQMWFGTRDGLNKYDGTSFKIYKNDPNDSLSISNNDILTIDEDQEGNIWVGTYYGLNSYNPEKNIFKRFFHSQDNSIPDNTIWSLKVMQGGNIWIGTSNGLSIYNPETGKFTNFEIIGANGLRSNLVLSIMQTKNGNIWLGTSNGVFKAIKQSNGNIQFKNFGTSLFVQDLIEDHSGNIWIASKNNGLLKYNEKTQEVSKFKKEGANKIHKDVRSLAIDISGILWLGTYEGINKVTNEGEVLKIVNNPYDQNSLSRNTIKSVFKDAKGSIWVGAYYGGLNIWDSSNSNFNNYSQNTNKNSLSYDVVSSIEANSNNLYFGTEGGGITVLNKNNQQTSYLNKATVKNFPSNNIKSLLLDNNQLWIGTFNAGIADYDLQYKKIVTDKLSNNLNDYLQGVGVYSIRKENDSILWIGSFGNGLIRYNSNTGNYKTFVLNKGDPNSLSGNSIRTLIISKQSVLWVGTDRGLNRIDLKKYNSGKLIVKHFLSNFERVTGEDILTLFEDSIGEIWIGTKYNGLFKYTGKTLEHITIDSSGNGVTAVHSILEDIQHNLWLSTNQGIITYNLANKKSTLYSQKDGLVSNEFNDNASLQIKDKIYFGGPAGVSSFNPQKITGNTYAPQVILTDFKIQNTPVDYRKKNDILEKSITYTQQIELNYDKSNFSISYAIPNFISSTNNQYSYRLVGLENQWTTTKNTEAAYTIQNAGTYLFEVKGANNDGIWNTTPTTLKIIVKPAPWKSIWAFFIYALFIGLALYGLFRIIKSKAKLKHELELEQIEAERSKEIHTAKLQFFTNISHEFRTPLSLILGPLQQILSGYNGSNILYKKLLVIESSANHLLQLINTLMDFRKLESNQFNLAAAEGNIVKFLKEIFLSFTEFAKDGGYTYTFNTSNEDIQVYYDRHKLERVFYNLISNAFKYTPKGGMVSMNVIKEEHQINIEIEDSGVGISEEYINKVFDRFFEVSIHKKQQNNYSNGTGIGLSIAKNIVNLHQGTISVENKELQGVIFKVVLPLGRSHLNEKEILKDFVLSDDVSQYASQLSSLPEVRREDLDDLMEEEKRHTILLVEDNKVFRSFLKDLLIKDYNILQAGDGKVAMKIALKHVPDLIISDVIMPEMVGTELCSSIKGNLKTSHIPVILLTSRTSLIYKFEGLESGADDYISKPFNLKEFKLRIYNLLESKERLKEKFSNQNVLIPSDIVVTSLDEQLLKKAFEIVEQNISNEQFDIPFFCSELGVSRSMLFTKIKAWTYFTPNKFILEIRLKSAAQLLEQNKINISQVSYKVGFNNPKYFSKCFQNKFGITPTQYANKFSED